ncbi:hypothetical protein [Sporomusa aerivorans]|uniref:hypothetical protein n=1 Tax=Sporomusa aerivorans TaxID=204936 RepID=UPI00352B3C99
MSLGYKKEGLQINSIAQDTVSSQPGLFLLETRMWVLPVTVMAVGFTLGGKRRCTLLEEFVLKCLASEVPSLKTQQGITALLRLDSIYVQNCLQELLQHRLVIQSTAAGEFIYSLTDLGRETCRGGLMPVPPGKETVYISVNAQFELLGITGQADENSAYPAADWPVFRYCSYRQTHGEFLSADSRADSLVKEQMAAWYGDDWPAIVTEKHEPQFAEERQQVFGEIWVYDVIRQQVLCHVWDFERQTFCEKLAAALTALEAGQRLRQAEQAFYQAVNDQKLVALFGKQRRQDNNTLPRIETFHDTGFFALCRQACSDMDKIILLTVPCIAEISTNETVLEFIRAAINRQGTVFIGGGPGVGADREPEPPPKWENVMQSLIDADSLPGVFLFEIGNVRQQAAVVDSRYCLLDLLPWLFYQGAQCLSKQPVARVFEASFVAEQSDCLQGLFLRQLEQQLLNGYFLDKANGVTWFCALLSLTAHGHIREILAAEAIEKVIAMHSGAFLLKILAVYIAKGEFALGFERLLDWLVQQGDNDAVTEWLAKLYMDSPGAYQKITAIYGKNNIKQ